MNIYLYTLIYMYVFYDYIYLHLRLCFSLYPPLLIIIFNTLSVIIMITLTKYYLCISLRLLVNGNRVYVVVECIFLIHLHTFKPT